MVVELEGAASTAATAVQEKAAEKDRAMAGLADQLEASKKETQQAKDDRSKDAEQKDGEIAALGSNLKAAQDATKQSRQDALQKQKRMDKLEQEHRDQLAAQETRIESLQSSKQGLDEQIVALRQEIEKLKLSQRKAKDLEDDLQANLTRSRQEIVTLKSSVQKAQGEVKSFKDRANGLQQTLESNQDEAKKTVFEHEGTIYLMLKMAARNNLGGPGSDAVRMATHEVKRLWRDLYTSDGLLPVTTLPSLCFARTSQEPHSLLDSITLWTSVVWDTPNMLARVPKQAQRVFDSSSVQNLPKQWTLETMSRLLGKLTGATGAKPIAGARLCLVVLQGLVLLLSDANRAQDPLRQLADDVESCVTQTPSSCLRSMMKQVNAGFSDASSIHQLKWLSDFDDSTVNRRLDSTNSVLSEGTSLIADESGLFFIVHADVLSVFTLDDVESATWDISIANSPRMPLTVYFHRGSPVNTDTLLLSSHVTGGRAIKWVLEYMRPRYRGKWE
ncbi:MAG: hypothetical protein Q9223_006876 [Gallowayella weberi]